MATNYQHGLRVSEYLLERCIGVGTFGEVWSATHHIWKNERVAVKLPTEPEYVRNLQREGLVAHGLRHANIVRVLGLDPYADPPYLVMELVQGPALKQVIAEHSGGMPIDSVRTILRGVLAGLAAAHAQHVLHRDLKPGNVLLDLRNEPLARLRVEQVKLVDFGLGVRRAATDVLQSMSLARGEERLVGTPAYMAPELHEPGVSPDARADLYAVGVMLFEMLTGHRPAGAERPSTLRAETPAALDALFERLYSRLERRCGSALDALAMLESPTPPVPGALPPIPPLPVAARGMGGCPRCGAIPQHGDQFCTTCGQQLQPPRRCALCDAFPAADDDYCTQCGTRLPVREGR